MSIQKELFYREFVQSEDSFYRLPYNRELEFYYAIRSGDLPKVKELCQERLIDKKGLGILSSKPLQNLKYHFVVTTALVARYCIYGGMDLSTAYSLSDFYIHKADTCTTLKEVSDLHPVMCEDYTKRMKALGKQRACSTHIANCLDYIYDHLHTRITIEQLAKHVNLNPSYLSRLFKKEVGTSVSNYVREKKIETARNMLVYSEYSLSEIASILAFPSQSYFAEIFRKSTGFTPSAYRALSFRNVDIGKQ